MTSHGGGSSGSKSQYIQTDTGNLVSRSCSILGSTNIILGGKTIIFPNVVVRGDLRRLASATATNPTGASSSASVVVVAIGKYSYLGEGSVVRPGSKSYKGVFSYYPIKIGDYVKIGSNCIIEAAQIGNGVEIGNNCIIGSLAIIKENAKILDNSVVAPGAIVPSLVEWSGSPARWSNMLAESTPEATEANAKKYYAQFLAEL